MSLDSTQEESLPPNDDMQIDQLPLDFDPDSIFRASVFSQDQLPFLSRDESSEPSLADSLSESGMGIDSKVASPGSVFSQETVPALRPYSFYNGLDSALSSSLRLNPSGTDITLTSDPAVVWPPHEDDLSHVGFNDSPAEATREPLFQMPTMSSDGPMVEPFFKRNTQAFPMHIPSGPAEPKIIATAEGEDEHMRELPMQTSSFPNYQGRSEGTMSDDELSVTDKNNSDEDYHPTKPRDKRSPLSKKPLARTGGHICWSTRLARRPKVSGRSGSMTLPSIRNTLRCEKCAISFKDEHALSLHNKMQHSHKMFCLFHFAGCNVEFERKNEWKRHHLTRHFLYTQWLCDLPIPSSPNPELDRCNKRPFPRKDLFSQHFRRVHLPAGLKGKPNPEEKELVKEMNEKARDIDYNRLPRKMDCTFGKCSREFSAGDTILEEWLEHQATHVERCTGNPTLRAKYMDYNPECLTSYSQRVRIIEYNEEKGCWKLLGKSSGTDNASSTSKSNSGK